MSSLRSRLLGLTPLCVAVMAVSACGGSSDDGTAAGAAPSPAGDGGGSTTAPTPTPTPTPTPASPPQPTEPADYTDASFADCPADVASAGWETLSCLTGKFKGAVMDAPTQSCAVSIRSDGWVSVEIGGRTLHHQIPSNADVAQGLGRAFYQWQPSKVNPYQAFSSTRSDQPDNAQTFTLDRYFDVGDAGAVARLEARIAGSDKACQTVLRLPEVTASQLRACPQAAVKPFNISALSCLVGVYRGNRLDRAGQPTGGRCELTIFRDGSLHAASPDPYEYIALPLAEPNGDYAVVSEYVGYGPDAPTVLSWSTHHQSALNDKVSGVATNTPAGLVFEWLYTATNAIYHDGTDSYLRCRSAPLP